MHIYLIFHPDVGALYRKTYLFIFREGELNLRPPETMQAVNLFRYLKFLIEWLKHVIRENFPFKQIKSTVLNQGNTEIIEIFASATDSIVFCTMNGEFCKIVHSTL